MSDDPEETDDDGPAPAPAETDHRERAVDSEDGDSSDADSEGRTGPLSDLAERVDGRREREDPAPPAEELFEDRSVDGVDREALWRQVAGESAPESTPDSPDGDGTSSESGGFRDGPRVERPDPTERTEGRGSIDQSEPAAHTDTPEPADREEASPATDPGTRTVDRPGEAPVEGRHERVVEKSKYCQNCKYFSAPPEVHCSHEGTQILEAVDMDHFRVVECPVVKEDEQLENV